MAEVLARIEVQLLKAVIANGQLKVFMQISIPILSPIPIIWYLQVVDGVCVLKGRVYCGDDSAALLHKYDFEWLLEAVVKVSYKNITSGCNCTHDIIYTTLSVYNTVQLCNVSFSGQP